MSAAHAVYNVIGPLGTRGVFIEGNKTLPGPQKPGSPLTDISTTPTVTKAALELRRLELREKEIEWERERTRLEANRQAAREKDKWEHERKMKDLEIAQTIRLKELDIKACESGVHLPNGQFDVTRNIRVVPPFREKEVDKFFAHFERVATVLKWPREVWTMTLQCVFVGKAQEAYAALSLEDAADYEKVKQAVLRIYSSVLPDWVD